MMNSGRDERQAAAKPAEENDHAGQLRPVPLRKHPRMELLMEETQ